MSMKVETLVNFFQLMGQHHSWDRVMILVFRIDAHDKKKKTEMCMRESDEKMLNV